MLNRFVIAAMLVLPAIPLGCRDPLRRPEVESIPVGVPSFARVSDGLYRGGQPTDGGYAELKSLGVKAVLSLRMISLDQSRATKRGLQYAHISCKPYHPEDEDVVEFLQIVTDPSRQPVFVHCRHGVDRTGMMVAAYRVVVDGWTRERAILEMRTMGPNGAYVDSIETYINHFDAAAIRAQLPHLPE